MSSEPRQIAHDLRTPLNTLCIASALLIQTTLDSQQRGYARMIRSSAEALQRLANQLDGTGADAEVPAAEAAEQVVPVPVRPLRVLIVDDDPTSRLATRSLLASLGHVSEEAADGRGALSALEQGGFDVVLMDVQMPGVDGPEAARRMRMSRADGRGPRIVGLTGTALAADLDACRAAGMDDVLLKPIDAASLRSVLEAAAPEHGPAGAVEPDEFLDPRVVASLSAHETTPGHSSFERLVDLYVADTPGQLALVRGAADRGDGADLARTAHRLKGSSSVIGARVLVALASEIESLARAGSVQRAAPVVADLERAWTATRGALESVTLRGARAS
jgi:CheY-like chemotaxis protein/HPt (histidine-containing phosphotransfer) domain-containing protein